MLFSVVYVIICDFNNIIFVMSNIFNNNHFIDFIQYRRTQSRNGKLGRTYEGSKCNYRVRIPMLTSISIYV